ncbi:lipopolysaccharide biosynthesis protein [Enterococcus cecorum]|uniref:lipopolysaccharide biosynthesis protein n=1 Tax=Enterococcus cecorum TaxID=44008 RepID=UPI000B06EE86|nr:oligosaccharide flippase family protein [Enterococcus cecorum]CAI3469821.1 hypothetical protein CIRMBP1308_01527 [Enterococcus cecorum]
MKNKYKNLLTNSLIFAIANFGSKILKFLIVPFYTYYLTTKQFGAVDLLTTTVSLLSPFVLLGTNEALLRFSFKKEIAIESLFSNCILICTSTSTVLLICLLFFKDSLFFVNKWMFFILLMITSIEMLLLYFSRGLNKNVDFAFAGVLNTVVLLASNIILLVYLHLGINGYIYSLILASLLSSIYLILRLQIYNFFSLKYLDLSLMRKILVYSLPMMPNAIMWWIMNTSDRYIIYYYLGIAATGIYAISYKLPSIISVITNIFYQAWQVSAIQNSDANDNFYSNVIDYFSKFSLLLAGILIFVIKPLIFLLVEKSYEISWMYTPFLILGSVFSGMSSVVGVSYTVKEKTVGIFKTSLIGAIVNIMLSLILTPFMGMQGTALATFIGFYLVWLTRVLQVKTLDNLNFDFKLFHIDLFLIFVEIIFLLLDNLYCTVFSFLVVVILLVNERKFLYKLITLIIKH